MTAGRVCGGAAGGGGVPLTVIGSYATKYASQVYLSNNWGKKRKEKTHPQTTESKCSFNPLPPKKGFSGYIFLMQVPNLVIREVSCGFKSLESLGWSSLLMQRRIQQFYKDGHG